MVCGQDTGQKLVVRVLNEHIHFLSASRCTPFECAHRKKMTMIVNMKDLSNTGQNPLWEASQRILYGTFF
jgi:hypothetical protein